MLQEILSQMYIDQELLDQLDEESKQVLFRKMREEQVRQYNVREAEFDKKPLKRVNRKIEFALGADGNPWVWVMGEHGDDVPYKELMRRFEQADLEKEKQREMQERKEAQELAKTEIMGIRSIAGVFGAIGKFRKPLRRQSGGTDTTDGPSPAREPSPANLKPTHLSVVRTESHDPMRAAESPAAQRKVCEDEEAERERTLATKASIIGLTDEEQSKFEKQRTEEVFMSLQRARSISKKRAANMAKNLENWWEESQKKANEYDKVRRTSFKNAREIATKRPDLPDKILESIPAEKQKEIIRRMTIDRKTKKPVRSAPGPPDKRAFKKQSSIVRPGTVPKSFPHVMSWFNKNEAPKGAGKERDGSISVWFHGKLSRDAAVSLLEGKPIGSFLLRLSTKIWGYTVSVKTYTTCKHFLVDASSGKYCFVGPQQEKFNSLTALLLFYKDNAVTWSGQEKLLLPVALEEDNADLYRGLYNDDEGLSEEMLAELEEGSTL